MYMEYLFTGLPKYVEDFALEYFAPFSVNIRNIHIVTHPWVRSMVYILKTSIVSRFMGFYGGPFKCTWIKNRIFVSAHFAQEQPTN